MLPSLLLAALAQAPSIPVPERPRDPWVFRCVLDSKPRIAAIALSSEMWLAYDATNCGLDKAWKGGVLFDGAVYTAEHGPQPTSSGPLYLRGIAGPVWEATLEDGRRASGAVWRGYELVDRRVVLLYEVALPGGGVATVRETPEFVRPEHFFDAEQREQWALQEGTPGLLRRFSAEGLPPRSKLTLAVRIDQNVGRFAPLLERERRVEEPQADGSAATHDLASLVLLAEMPRAELLVFFAPRPEPPPAPAAQAPGAEPPRADEAKGGRR